jgi:hypothetical protein
MRAPLRRLAALPLCAALCGSTVLAGCGGPAGPPHHPVAELSARATAKLGLIDLVVDDPLRAQRVRQVYLRMAALAREFDEARAHSLLQARSLAAQRSAEADPAALERLLAPPIAHSRSLFDRYAALQLEARSLLTEREFDQLNHVR